MTRVRRFAIRWPLVCASVALGGGFAALAADPATRPADPKSVPPATRPAANRPSPFGGRMIRLRDLSFTAPEPPNAMADRPSDEQDWHEVSQFAKDNFPNRWALFEQVQAKRGADSPLVKSLRGRFTSKYRLMMRIQRMMPNLYDAALAQGKLEDDAWGAVVAARKKPSDRVLADRMRQKVSALVDNVLAERQSRLDTLRQTLADEQKQLDSDRERVDDMVERQIERLNSDDPAAGFDRFPRVGGSGGSGRGGWDRPDPPDPAPATRPTNY